MAHSSGPSRPSPQVEEDEAKANVKRWRTRVELAEDVRKRSTHEVARLQKAFVEAKAAKDQEKMELTSNLLDVAKAALTRETALLAEAEKEWKRAVNRLDRAVAEAKQERELAARGKQLEDVTAVHPIGSSVADAIYPNDMKLLAKLDQIVAHFWTGVIASKDVEVKWKFYDKKSDTWLDEAKVVRPEEICAVLTLPQGLCWMPQSKDDINKPTRRFMVVRRSTYTMWASILEDWKRRWHIRAPTVDPWTSLCRTFSPTSVLVDQPPSSAAVASADENHAAEKTKRVCVATGTSGIGKSLTSQLLLLMVAPLLRQFHVHKDAFIVYDLGLSAGIRRSYRLYADGSVIATPSKEIYEISGSKLTLVDIGPEAFPNPMGKFCVIVNSPRAKYLQHIYKVTHSMDHFYDWPWSLAEAKLLGAVLRKDESRLTEAYNIVGGSVRALLSVVAGTNPRMYLSHALNSITVETIEGALLYGQLGFMQNRRNQQVLFLYPLNPLDASSSASSRTRCKVGFCSTVVAEAVLYMHGYRMTKRLRDAIARTQPSLGVFLEAVSHYSSVADNNIRYHDYRGQPSATGHKGYDPPDANTLRLPSNEANWMHSVLKVDDVCGKLKSLLTHASQASGWHLPWLWLVESTSTGSATLGAEVVVSSSSLIRSSTMLVLLLQDTVASKHSLKPDIVYQAITTCVDVHRDVEVHFCGVVPSTYLAKRGCEFQAPDVTHLKVKQLKELEANMKERCGQCARLLEATPPGCKLDVNPDASKLQCSRCEDCFHRCCFASSDTQCGSCKSKDPAKGYISDHGLDPARLPKAKKTNKKAVAARKSASSALATPQPKKLKSTPPSSSSSSSSSSRKHKNAGTVDAVVDLTQEDDEKMEVEPETEKPWLMRRVGARLAARVFRLGVWLIPVADDRLSGSAASSTASAPMASSGSK